MHKTAAPAKNIKVDFVMNRPDNELYRLATRDEVKQCQMEVLGAVDEFCRKNGIKYFLYYGTLLGAVRHKGYIPWDDDIDIAMLREDYDRFVREFSHDRVKVYDSAVTKDYPYTFAKVFDGDTVEIEAMGKDGYSYGIGLDLFPLENVPDNEEKKTKMYNALRLWRLVRGIKCSSLRKKRSAVANVVLAVAKCALFFVSPVKVVARMKKIADKYKDEPSGGVADMMLPYKERSIVDKALFDTTVDAEFEGRHFLIPAGYDGILGRIYGNYMELPPEEKRISPHLYDAYVKNKTKEG